MNKKEYKKPELKEIKLKARAALLQGSGPDEWHGGFGMNPMDSMETMNEKV